MRFTLSSLIEASAHVAHVRYLIAAGSTAVFVLLALPFELFIKPLARQFRLDDMRIAYPFMPEHVPVPLLAFVAIFLPMLVISVPAFTNARYMRHSIVSLLGLVLAISSTLFVCDVFKWFIGNQRPDFLARCMPKPGVERNVMVTVESVCTNPNMSLVWEGCRSTPSGHSSLSFAGMVFLSLWILSFFQLGRTTVPVHAKAIAAGPVLVAAYIAYTRIIDHKHHWADVISGGILGSALAFGAYMFTVAHAHREFHRQEPLTAQEAMIV